MAEERKRQCRRTIRTRTMGKMTAIGLFTLYHFNPRTQVSCHRARIAAARFCEFL